MIRQTPLATPSATPPTTSSLSSPTPSTRKRSSVLVCGYGQRNSPYCSLNTSTEERPKSDCDQVPVHGDRHLLGLVGNKTKQQLILLETAAERNTVQLSCALSDSHTGTLPSVPVSPVLPSLEGRSPSIPITSPGKSVSQTLVSNPGSETGRLLLHSSTISILGESIDCSSHKSAFTFPRIMDVGELLQQLHDDHHTVKKIFAEVEGYPVIAGSLSSHIRMLVQWKSIQI